MVRQPTSTLVWQEDSEGGSAGPFVVRLESPGRWQLLAKGRVAGFYPTKSAAHHAAADLQRRHGLKRRLFVSLAVAGVFLLGLAAALAGRTEPNPAYPPARAIADQFDQARLAVEAGELGIDQVGEQFDGIQGASFTHVGRIKLGLAGVFNGDCYGMVWRLGQQLGGVVVRSDFVTCQPDPSLIDQPDPPGLVAEPLRPAWKFALPDVDRQRAWFIPAFAVCAGFFLTATFRATALLFALRK
jgi:hypothetical protein